MSFQIRKFQVDQVEQYLFETKVNDDNVDNVFDNILNNEAIDVYYLSDFYTFNGTSEPKQEQLITDARFSTNVDDYEKTKIFIT